MGAAELEPRRMSLRSFAACLASSEVFPRTPMTASSFVEVLSYSVANAVVVSSVFVRSWTFSDSC